MVRPQDHESSTIATAAKRPTFGLGTKGLNVRFIATPRETSFSTISEILQMKPQKTQQG